MISKKWKRATSPWVPAGFCAFLSLVTIVSNLWLTVVIGRDYGGWAIGFLCFLPMCFFFVGALTSQMQREIQDLRKQIAELQRDNDRESR
jgi:hypothetical protein